jgi:hypothetical protein
MLINPRKGKEQRGTKWMKPAESTDCDRMPHGGS